jgi:peptidoglycan/LPS O-acetylase OafA/YrhL
MKETLESLTALRFFAAFLVFLDHYVVVNENWGFPLGCIAITFFFTLSGFVLTFAYRDAFKQQQITKSKFYIGRFARVWPLHILCLLLMVPFALQFFYLEPLKSSIYLVANLLLLQDFIPHSADLLNSPSWSISAEFFFYLLFPGLLGLALKSIKVYFISLMLFLIFLIGMALRFSGADTSVHNISLLGITHISFAGIFYVFPPVRIFDFMCGIALFFVYEKIYTKKFAMFFSCLEVFGLLLLGLTYVFHNLFLSLLQVGLIFLPAVLLILAGFSGQKGALSKALSKRWIILLGEASFAFYLLQEPLNQILWVLFHEFLHSRTLLQLIHFIVLIILSILIHKLFELPLYRRIREFFGVNRTVTLKNYLS